MHPGPPRPAWPTGTHAVSNAWMACTAKAGACKPCMRASHPHATHLPATSAAGQVARRKKDAALACLLAW